MKRFLQIFTCGKWHLLPDHEPFYLVRLRTCNPLGRLEPNEDGVAVLVQRNARLHIKFRFINAVLTALRKLRDGLMLREGITQLDSRFFQGVEDTLFPTVTRAIRSVGAQK